MALVSKDTARLFTVFAGAIEETIAFEDFVPGKTDAGGLKQSKIQRHHELHVLWHLKKVVAYLSEAEPRHDFDRLILMGPVEATSELQEILPHVLKTRRRRRPPDGGGRHRRGDPRQSDRGRAPNRSRRRRSSGESGRRSGGIRRARDVRRRCDARGVVGGRCPDAAHCRGAAAHRNGMLQLPPPPPRERFELPELRRPDPTSSETSATRSKDARSNSPPASKLYTASPPTV